MKFSTALLVLLTYVVASEAVAKPSTGSPTLRYWHQKLPTAAIPYALRELISPLSSSELLADLKEESDDQEKVSVNVGKGGVNVATGKPKPKPQPKPKPSVTKKPSPGRKGGVGVHVGKGGVSVGKQPGKGTGVHVGDKSPFNYNYAASDDEIMSDPSLSSIFFLEKELHSGTKVNLQFLERSSSRDSRVFFLPRRLAEAIPFSSQKLSVALEKLNISQGSEKALAMEQTLEECETPAISGESKYCATSLESMIDYSTSTVGTNDVNVLATNVEKGQQYTITGFPFRSKSGAKSVACHRQTYAYAVYYCHETEHTSTARVSLKGEDGSRGEGVAVCHTDTSGWNPQHLAFKALHIKPGGAAVCHFIPNDHIVWLPAN